MFRFILLTAMWLIALQNLSSQETTVYGVEGRWPIVNITPEMAREKAIEEAKREALSKAGIEERIKMTDVLSTYEVNDLSSQMVSSFSSIELNGAVTRYSVTKDRKEKDGVDGLLYAVVTIDATVRKYATIPDPEFKIDVRGLRNNGYRNGEAITFSVRPNKDGYLKVFLFENMTDAELLFPNDYEQNSRLKEKETVKFPTVSRIDYAAEKLTTERQEHNLLMFVYTKRDIPFHGDVTCQRVMRWINEIEPNEREVVMHQVMVTE